LGVLAYVLLAGRPPFSSNSKEELFDHIQNDTLDLDNDDRLQDVSAICRQFISDLLVKDPAKRLGCAGSDAADVQKHPFFAGVDWDAVVAAELPAPLAPALQEPSDSGTAVANPQEVKHAQRKLADKVHAKHKPGRGAARTRHLDAVEYKHVRVGSADGGKTGRVSIGLDFDGTSATAAGKTWTGTADDFGRVITT